MTKDPDSEMLAVSDLTVKAAKQELGKTLDYSTDSFKELEALIQHVKSHFLNLKNEGKLTEQTVQRASISIGGYFGEVIKRHHGGTWIARNNVMKVLIINGQEFSPVLYIFERLTKASDYSLENYWTDMHKKLYPQNNIKDSLPVWEKSSKTIDKTNVSNLPDSLSQVAIVSAVGVGVILLIVALSSPEYGNAVCGVLILLALGFAIWLWTSSNSKRNATISKAVQEQKQSSYKPSIKPKADPHAVRSQSNTVACRSCGQKVARTAPVCPNCGDTFPGLIAKCPKCGSKSIRIIPKGFSLGKSAAGAVILGPLGVLGGLHGRHDLKVTCSSCHNAFTIKSYEI
jgi:hypothetical protein